MDISRWLPRGGHHRFTNYPKIAPRRGAGTGELENACVGNGGSWIEAVVF